MCSIIGSFKKDKLAELADLNRYRGEHSHSLYVFCPETNNIKFQHKALGSLNFNEHELPDGYIVAHQQAPTTEKLDNNIHPAEWKNNLLWHNGIIKASTVKRLQEIHESDETWDTKLMLYNLDKFHETHALEELDGSFSCLWMRQRKYGPELVLFRNEISPMFIDDDFNISSNKFKGAKPTEANTIHFFDMNYMQLAADTKFKTVNNPYYGI